MPDVGQADLIAIGDTETFQTLSSSDLAGCRRLGQTFFCEGSSVLKTNLVHDQAWSSLSQNFCLTRRYLTEPNGRPFNEILTDRKKKAKISVQYRLKFHGAGKSLVD